MKLRNTSERPVSVICEGFVSERVQILMEGKKESLSRTVDSDIDWNGRRKKDMGGSSRLRRVCKGEMTLTRKMKEERRLGRNSKLKREIYG